MNTQKSKFLKLEAADIENGLNADFELCKEVANRYNTFPELLEALQMWVDYMDSDLSEGEKRLLEITKAAITKATS